MAGAVRDLVAIHMQNKDESLVLSEDAAIIYMKPEQARELAQAITYASWTIDDAENT